METVIKQKNKVILTPADVKIVFHLSHGVTVNKMKRHGFDMNPRTIESRLIRLKTAYKCKTSTHLVAYCLRNKIIE